MVPSTNCVIRRRSGAVETPAEAMAQQDIGEAAFAGDADEDFECGTAGPKSGGVATGRSGPARIIAVRRHVPRHMPAAPRRPRR